MSLLHCPHLVVNGLAIAFFAIPSILGIREAKAEDYLLE
jgi:hypothetical protein